MPPYRLRAVIHEKQNGPIENKAKIKIERKVEIKNKKVHAVRRIRRVSDHKSENSGGASHNFGTCDEAIGRRQEEILLASLKSNFRT